MVYNTKEKVVSSLDNYSPIASEVKQKIKHGKGLNILTPKQVLQRLPIALPQVKADNASEHLLNEIHQIVNSFYQAKEITKKVYKNIMNSKKAQYKWLLYL